MKTEKVTLTVKIEVLSVDAIAARLYHLAKLIDEEQISGSLSQEDGDSTEWAISFSPVIF